MTIKIEIEVPFSETNKEAYLASAMAALGFYRPGTATREELKQAEAAADRYDGLGTAMSDASAAEYAKAATDAAVTGVGYVQMDANGETRRVDPSEMQAPALDKRPVGSPSDGNKRRNSAEKAEDDEFEKLAAEKGIALDKVNAGIAQVGRAEAKAQLSVMPGPAVNEEPQAAISTGEERIGPEDEQDAADEAAETEKSGLAPIDVLRRLLGDYQKKHGMPAAVKLCQEGGLIGKPIHELDDAGIEAAIARMSASTVSPLSPETKAEPVEEKLAPKTKADLIDAMMRYGDKYDGTREQAKMTHTLADMPVLFADLFGPEVTKLSQVPEDGYARAVAAVEAAIENDPYGRAK